MPPTLRQIKHNIKLSHIESVVRKDQYGPESDQKGLNIENYKRAY